MRKFLSLFSCWLLLSGSISQAPPTAFPDTPTITENSVGKARIGMPVARLQELYKGCTFTPVHLGEFGFDDYGPQRNAVAVSYNRQKLFVFFPGGKADKVAGFFVLQPAYKTAAGIHVGSTSGQLKAALPAVRVGPNELMIEMEIAAVKRVVRGEEQLPIVEYIFNKQGFLGKNKDFVVPSEIAVLNAKISWIQVFPNP